MAAKKPAAKKKPAKSKKSSFKLDVKGIVLIAAALIFALVGAYFVFFSKAAAPLTWSPPTGYQNYPVKNVSVSSSFDQNISGGGGDMLVKLPSSPTGPITISDCRNVVIIGGQINIPAGSGPAVPDVKGIYVKGCTGTVHIEGVYINGDIATAEGDGIAINAPQAIVQVQNVRINKLFGGQDTDAHNHSDIIQPWGGVKELRVDYLTGTSNYQGFQVNDDRGHIGKVTIKNTNIGDSGVKPPTSNGGYYLWVKCGTGTAYSFSNFYIQPRSDKSFGNSLWDGGCGLKATSTSASYSNSAMSGTILAGKPAAGDFVPAGAAGIGYKSPGYAEGTTAPTNTTTTPPPTTTTPPPPAPIGPVAVISESFDSSTANMQQILGGWSVTGGRYAITNVKSVTTGNGNIAVNNKVLTGNFVLSTNGLVSSTSGVYDDFSIIVGYVDKSNYYYASFNETNDSATNGIFRVKNGAITQLKDFSSVIKSGTDYKIGVSRTADILTVTRDGVVVGSVSDSSFTTGKVGFGSRNNAASFDNLTVTQ